MKTKMVLATVKLWLDKYPQGRELWVSSFFFSFLWGGLWVSNSGFLIAQILLSESSCSLFLI